MKFFPKRYLEEFFLYSSQFVLFFIVLLFSTPEIVRPPAIAIVSLIIFLLVQIALLALFGHKPWARFLCSFITPLCYTLICVIFRSRNALDMPAFFLWAFVIYLGGLQAISMYLTTKNQKKIAEFFLSLGTILTFIFFYFYLDLLFNNVSLYNLGILSYDELFYSLSIPNFGQAFKQFIKIPRNWFFIFGVLVFGSFQISDKIKQVSLKIRINQLYNAVKAPVADTKLLKDSKAYDSNVVILYSDLWNYTGITEKASADAKINVLNKYYAAWSIIAKRHGGVIDQFVSDSVIIIFGLLDEQNAADNAVDCAFDFLGEFSHFQDDLTNNNLPLIKQIGIGIHAGKVAIGELSVPKGERRIAAVGEELNAASRLDSLCREFKQDFLISDNAYKILSLESQAKFLPMGEVLFKGHNTTQTVYKKK